MSNGSTTNALQQFQLPLYVDAGLLVVGLVYGVLMWGRVEDLRNTGQTVSVERISRMETRIDVNTMRLATVEARDDQMMRASEARRELAILEARIAQLEARIRDLERELGYKYPPQDTERRR